MERNQLVEKIDRIPLEISPRRSQPVGTLLYPQGTCRY